MDAASEQFTHTVREYISALTIFVILFAVSFGFLWPFKAQRDEEFDDIDDSVDRKAVPFFLSVLAFAMALGAVMLVPFTLVAETLMELCPTNEYVSWLSAALLFDLWEVVFWGSQPMTESIGLAGRWGMGARMCETSVLVVLVTALLGGVAYIIKQTLEAEHTMDVLLAFSVLVGGAVFAWVAPSGLFALNGIIAKLFIPFSTRRGVQAALDVERLELLSLQTKLSQAVDEFSKERLGQQVIVQTEKVKNLTLRISTWPLLRNISYFILAFVTRIFFVIMFVRVAVHSRLFMDASAEYSLLSDWPLVKFILGLPHPQISAVRTAVDALLVLYFVLCAIAGLWQLRLTQLIPRLGQTPVRSLVARTAGVLTMASALPGAASILGLAGGNVLGRYGSTRLLREARMLTFYTPLFLTALLFRLIPWSAMGRLLFSCLKRRIRKEKTTVKSPLVGYSPKTPRRRAATEESSPNKEE